MKDMVNGVFVDSEQEYQDWILNGSPGTTITK